MSNRPFNNSVQHYLLDFNWNGSLVYTECSRLGTVSNIPDQDEIKMKFSLKEDLFNLVAPNVHHPYLAIYYPKDIFSAL